MPSHSHAASHTCAVKSLLVKFDYLIFVYLAQPKTNKVKSSFGSISFIFLTVISQMIFAIQILISAWITNCVVGNKIGMDGDQQNRLNSPRVTAFEPLRHRLMKMTRYCRIIHMLFPSRIHNTVHWHFWSAVWMKDSWTNVSRYWTRADSISTRIAWSVEVFQLC